MIAAMLALAAALTVGEPAVYNRDTATITQVADHPWGGTARIVRRGRGGQPVVLRLDVPATGMPVSASHFFAGRDLELFVISGRLTIGSERFAAGDYAFVPAGAPIPARIGSTGASILWLEEDAPPASAAIMRQAMVAWRAEGTTATARWRIKRSADVAWVPGQVAAAAGVPLDLKIKHLRNDPRTGARTFLVSMGRSVKVPWERHPSIEEGFLVSGGFRLEECLPEGLKSSIYRPGGYFHRPPGVVHSGPNSGPTGLFGAVWLIRTPEKLVAEFLKPEPGKPCPLG